MKLSATFRSHLLLTIPVALAIAVHLPSLSHEFLGDDGLLILRNPAVTQPTSLRSLWLSDYFATDSGSQVPGGGIGYYRPLTRVAYRLTYADAGPNPRAFHAVSVAAHVLATLALALLIAEFASPLGAALGASLFAVHPSVVEAVDIPTALSDVLAAAFALIALFALARSLHASRGRRAWTVASVVALVLALGSKESVLLLPIGMVALAITMGLGRWEALRRTTPHFVAWAGALGLRFFVARVLPQPTALGAAPLSTKLASVLEVVGRYMGPIFLARPIVFFPQIPASLRSAGPLLGLATVLLFVGVLWKTRLKHPAGLAIVLGILWLAPALVLWEIHVPSYRTELPMAERWLYLPSAALGFLFAVTVDRLPPRWAAGLGAALLLALVPVTLRRSENLRSEESHMAYFVEEAHAHPSELSPNDRYLALTYEGYFLKQRDPAEAIAVLKEAVSTAPWLADAYKQLADAQYRAGDFAGCSATLEWLLSEKFATAPEGVASRAAFTNDTLMRMDRGPLWRLLGRALAAQQRWAEAAAAYREAVRFSHSDAETDDDRRSVTALSARARTSAGTLPASGVLAPNGGSH